MHSNTLNYSQVCGLQQIVHQVHQGGQNAASPSHVLWLTYCIWHSARPLNCFLAKNDLILLRTVYGLLLLLMLLPTALQLAAMEANIDSHFKDRIE